jgi:cell division protein FtsI (penicillin-binding protein 3)
LKPETAIQMQRFMEGVVLRGTGRNLANLRGYTSGGKTGTAQVYDFKARAYTHRYNASFVGFAPVQNPQIVIAVTMNNTSGGTAGYGGPVAAPVFRDVAMTALRILDVPKDLPDTDLRAASAAPKPETQVADLAIAGVGEPPADVLDARNDTARMPAVSSNIPSPPVPAESAATATDSDADRRHFLQTAEVTGPKVPSFRGMTLRQVLEESSAEGFQVEVGGAVKIGLAREQDPPAGAILPRGKRIRVQFAK